MPVVIILLSSFINCCCLWYFAFHLASGFMAVHEICLDLYSSVSVEDIYLYQSPNQSPQGSASIPPNASQINYSVNGSCSSYEGSFTLETGEYTNGRETIPLRSLRSNQPSPSPLAKVESIDSNNSSIQSHSSSCKNGATGTSFLR